MSESWPPSDYPSYGEDRPQRPPRPSGPRQPPRDPRSGGRSPDPAYGGRGPQSGGYGQQRGGWGPSSGDGWGAPPGAGGPRGPQPYPPYPPQAAPYPPQAAPYPPQYAPYPPQQAPSYAEHYGYGYGDPYGPRGPYEPEQPRRSGAGIAALVILAVVLVALAGGGAYALTHIHRPQSAATAQPTATATADTSALRPVTDPTAHIQFGVPQGWTTIGTPSTKGGLQTESPDHTTVMIVAMIAIPSGDSYDPVAGAKGGLAGAANYTPVNYEQGPTDVPLAGSTWTQEIGSFTRDNVPLRGVILVTERGGNAYLLAMIAQVDSFNAANAKDFQPLEQSFTFMS